LTRPPIGAKRRAFPFLDIRTPPPMSPQETSPHEIAKDQLKSFVERIERLEEEKKATADDIKDVYAEAKATGYDTKVLRKVVQIRKQDKNERLEQEAILDLYLEALGLAG
jgi:uncharacterized protein (UPF0335 family)